MVRRLQGRCIEPGPITAAGDRRISEPITDGAVVILYYSAAMQQNDHRTFLPAPRAAVEPAMNDVVFRDVARSRRGKLETYSRLVGIQLNRCRLGFDGNEVRPFQKLKRFLQPRTSSIDVRLAAMEQVQRDPDLQDRPINEFGNRRDHIWSFGGF